MTHLTVSDLSTLDGEPRIRDLVLAERLGFALPREIRRLIDRNREELRHFGGLCQRATNPGPQGGRPSRDTYLNEAQALLICMFARTPLAAEVRKAVIEVFMAWRAGKTVPVKRHQRRPPRRALANPYSFSAVKPYEDAPYTVTAVVPWSMAHALIRTYHENEHLLSKPFT